MKKRFALLVLVLCMIFVTSCVYIPEKTLTGDVKDTENSAVNSDAPADVKTDADISAQAPNPEDVPEKEQNVSQNGTLARKAIADMGAVESDGTEFDADAQRFLEALKNKDMGTVAGFTGGEAEYYSFLDDIEIAGYEIYPFGFSDEYLTRLGDEGKYYVITANYLVELDVKESSYDGFEKGKNLYYLGFEFDAGSGINLAAFVPAQKAPDCMFYEFTNDYTEYFIGEFSAQYLSRLTDGKNFPDSFDFSRDSHLITHLMARSGRYDDYPPYSLRQINDFISESFDGNDGMFPYEIDNDMWLYRMDSDKNDPDKIYGCSYGHGGDSVEHDIVSVESYGEEKIYTVVIYADYSRFARAMTLIYHFDAERGDIPELEMIELRDNTGNAPARLSF